MLTGSPGHLKSFDYLGLHLYFLTFCTHNRARKQAFGEKLWQRYGYEHVLRSDEDSLSVARYIVENPLRAGLVERVQDYPYLGSEIHTIEQILEAVQMEMST